METANHTKNLVNPSLARFIIKELMGENTSLRKRRLELLEIQRTTLEPFAFTEFEQVTQKLNRNLEWLQKMEVVMEMEESYKSGDLPQGYTMNNPGYGLNNPANR